VSDIGGVHIKYLLHCPRQLWLYMRGYRPEQRSDAVAYGEAVDDTTYTRRRDIDLGEAKIDWVTTGAVIHETKSSRAPRRPADPPPVSALGSAERLPRRTLYSTTSQVRQRHQGPDRPKL
jgi:CRISPR/Cas system-associated exonuclease Cas4 (RecB family)